MRSFLKHKLLDFSSRVSWFKFCPDSLWTFFSLYLSKLQQAQLMFAPRGISMHLLTDIFLAVAIAT